MYHFFHAKEELRSAKIAALVLAVAFASWGPFVALVSLPEGISLALAAPWLHLASCSLATAFAALSPYVYVFRWAPVFQESSNEGSIWDSKFCQCDIVCTGDKLSLEGRSE